VFYELLAGLDEEEKLKYGLLEANKYFYLNQGRNCIIEILGFTKQEQDTIFKMLASVLHVGNIYFVKKQVINLN